MAKIKRSDGKSLQTVNVVLRSAPNGKIESVEPSGADRDARIRFLRNASLNSVSKKSSLTQAKAQAAVRKYFNDHAELATGS
ncbi:hypothetical protein [Aurantiacibacter aquimixticola]|uniref:Uncharacterized protein n=1 Tax=Aurantiacibacter aquimixticola TaxID=1958945 RepID=A0A419RNH4_9SPHN|nr:hypothetical protein [Aurantiacibacter aquimixticola]RJY06936.1 hypothetical protein D6201_12730 [Aurantiacibacter aquimixticola]